MTVCIPISYISKGRQRVVLRGRLSTPKSGRASVTGTVSLGWRWSWSWSWSQDDPVQGQGWQLRVLGWGQSTVTSNLSLWANEPTRRNVCCCEGWRTEVTVRIRFEHSGDEAVQGVHVYSAKHFGMCPLWHQTSPAALTEG